MKPEETKPSSGGSPEKRKPTVIRPRDIPAGGQRNRPNPTVIGATSRAPKPSVIKPQTASQKKPIISAEATTPSPTRIGVTGQKIAKSETPTVRVTEPTAIAGEQRKRLTVTLGDLSKLHPRAETPVLEKALDQILRTNVPRIDDDCCVFWGTKTQNKYGDLVNRSIAISEATILRDTVKDLGKLQQALDGIDLERLLGLESRLSRLFHKKEDALEQFERAQTEIKKLVELLKEKQGHLLDHENMIEKLAAEMRELAPDIEALIISSHYLSDYLRKAGHNASSKRLSELLTERTMSLTRTLVQIGESVLFLDQQRELPLQLISSIQSTVLVQVPDWLSSYANLKGMVETNQNLTRTHLDELSRRKTEILKGMKV